MTDIVERLNDSLVWASPRERALRTEAAAEIVRLRGELAVANECLGEERAANVLRTPAPAMPNGVEYDRELIAEILDQFRDALTNGELDGAGCYTPGTIDEQAQLLRDAESREASTVTRAADNCDAAGVCDCPGIGKADKTLHAPNCPVRTAPAAAPAGEAVAYSVVQIGNRGAAYDPPNTHRAFTYEHQPGNIDASRLGRATNAAAVASAGDSIDRGLSLLKELQALGFGVFQIGPPSPKESPQPADGEAVAPHGRIRWLDGDFEIEWLRDWAGGDCDVYLGTTPQPAPVQAAPQEGEQDTSRWPLLDRVEFALRDAGFDYDEAFRIAHMAAHPSACELVVDASKMLRGRVRPGAAFGVAVIDVDCSDFGPNTIGDGHEILIHNLTKNPIAALQHRGDSRGGES